MPHRFAETVGLDNSFEFFFPGKNPDLGAGSAGGFYAGQVARPGFYARQARQWSAMKNENFNMSIRHVEAIRFQGHQGGRGFYAGQVARPGCPQDDDPPRCAGNLAFVTLVPPMSRKRGWASQYSLGPPKKRK